MLPVLLRPAADADLLDAYDYVAETSQARAERLVQSISDTFERLAEYPHMGRERSDVAPGLRSFVSGAYVVFYTPTAEAVVIERVVRSERDMDALFG